MEKILRSPIIIKTVKAKTVAAASAITCAVALPQIFHTLGAVLNIGTSLGEIFLPMHISILLVGLLAGPTAGFISGALAPILSFLLTGMPMAAMLPFMIVELSMYGLFSGLATNLKLPSITKLLIAQIGGRAVRAIAICVGYYFFSAKIAPVTVLTSISKGLPGLILQWVLIPLIVLIVDKKSQNE